MLTANSQERTMSRELLIQYPDGLMKTVPLTGARLSIGRSSAAELCFPEDAGLSRQHFAFEPEGDDWTVQDLGSKNGTFVNNIPLKARLILKPGDRVTAGHLVIVYAPDAPDPAARVVVFEGEIGSPTTSTVVTSLAGALSNQTMAIERGGPNASAPMQALIRAGQELTENRPLHELFPVILDLAIQAVNAQRGVLMILEGDGLVPRAHKGDGFRISTAVRDRVLKERSSILVRDAQLDDAFKGRRSIVEREARRPTGRRLQGPHEHRGAESAHHDGGALADQGPHHWPDLPGLALHSARIHQGRSEPAHRDGQHRGHPHRERAPGGGGTGGAHHGARALAGGGDSRARAARNGPRRSGRRSGGL